ncbi:MAG TPA: protein kinase [Streptosporangiaceae bacterium]|nr:protein kinase [Streptosporangiaceae bacterium]
MHSALGPGDVVAGRYRLLDQVGRGAMGIVWRGRDELLDRDVAVKQIALPPMASAAETQASYQRTLREARTAARLSHPGVVTVFDVVEHDGTPWIVMELVRARPLDQVIAEDGPLPPAQAAQLGISLLDALTAAHSAGVLHRDVKPSNVLISPDGKAVLTDFGIATIQGDPALTLSGMVVGTPGFSPPERVRGTPASPASDLWSLGATLYAAVEGRGPFDRAGGSAAIVASIATEPAPRAPSAGPLAPVIEALLRADPAQRPDSATAARMLADAWTASRTPVRTPGPAGQAADPADGQAASSNRPEQQAAPVPPGTNATTATQAVAVPPVGANRQAGSEPQGASPAGAAAGQAGTAPASSADPAGASSGSDGLAPAFAAGTPASSGPDGAIGVVPDLAATPVFAELKMPEPDLPPDDLQDAGNLSAAGPLGLGTAALGPAGLGPADQDHLPAGASGRVGELFRSRRRLLLVTPIAIAAVAAGILLAFPGLGDSLVQAGGGDQTSGTAARLAGKNVKASEQPRGRSSATRVAPSSASNGQPPGASGRPSPSAHPTRSSKPTPATSVTPSPNSSNSSSPSPSPSQTSPAPPAGYLWQSVSAASVGTVAGFRVAVPATWLMSPGLTTSFRPVHGSTRLRVDLAPFAVQGPVKEARHLQAVAVAKHQYRDYHLVSILAVTFHGRPAATWIFWWRPKAGATAVDVTELIYTARTTAGPQPYILSMSNPAPRAGWASSIFRVAMRTFTPLP